LLSTSSIKLLTLLFLSQSEFFVLLQQVDDNMTSTATEFDLTSNKNNL
jgi:hypothetical protein